MLFNKKHMYDKDKFIKYPRSDYTVVVFHQLKNGIIVSYYNIFIQLKHKYIKSLLSYKLI